MGKKGTHKFFSYPGHEESGILVFPYSSLSGRGSEVILLVWNVVFDDEDSKKIYGIHDLPGWFKYILDIEETLNQYQRSSAK